jgi:hypothetical protein
VAALGTGLYTAAAAQAAKSAEERSAAAQAREEAAQHQAEEAQKKMTAAGRSAAEASTRAQAAQRAAREAEQVKLQAEQARSRAQAMAQQAVRQSALADVSRKQAEAASQAARRQSEASVQLVSNVFRTSVIPRLRRASSEAPAAGTELVTLVREEIEPVRTLNPSEYGALSAEILAEVSELMVAQLDTSNLTMAASIASQAAAIEQVSPASREFSRTLSALNQGRALSLHGKYDEAASAFQAALGTGSPGQSQDSATNRVRGAALLGLAEAHSKRGRTEQAAQAVNGCLAALPTLPQELGRLDVDGYDFKLLRAGCVTVGAGLEKDREAAFSKLNIAAADILDLRRVRPASPELERASFAVAAQFIKLVGEINEPPAGESASLQQLLEGLEDILGEEDPNATAGRLVRARQADPLADKTPLNLWLGAELLTDITMLAAKTEDSVSDSDMADLLRAGSRYEYLALVFQRRANPADEPLRAMISGSVDRYTGVLLMLQPKLSNQTMVFGNVDQQIKALQINNDLLGPRSQASAAARNALLKRAVEISEATQERMSQVRYTELDRYTAALTGAVGKLCEESGAVPAEGCERLAEVRREFADRAQALESTISDRVSRARLRQAVSVTWADAKGVALAGHDPLSCRTAVEGIVDSMAEDAPIVAVSARREGPSRLADVCQLRPGRYEWLAEWDGRVWLFESEANRKRFVADPWLWAPQFGGHDTIQLAAKPVLAQPGAGTDSPTIYGGYWGDRFYLFSQDPRSGGEMGSALRELSVNSAGANGAAARMMGVTAAAIRAAAANWVLAAQRRDPVR